MASRLFLTSLAIILSFEAGIIYLHNQEWKSAVGRPNLASFEWVEFWGGAGWDTAKAVASRRGAVFVSGTTTSYGSGKSDIFLLKYSDDGALVWNVTWGGQSYDGCWATAVDDEGIYVAGFTYVGGGQEAKLASFTFNGESAHANVALLKYDFEGDLQWVRSWGREDDVVARGVAVDGWGFVYVSGYIRGTETTEESFLLKYDRTGDLVWSGRFGEEGLYALGVDVDDFVYVGGTSEFAYGNLWKSETFLMKFDRDGNLLWDRRWGGSLLNYCWSIHLSGGQVYMAGTTMINAGNDDAALLDYSSDGSLRFNKTWGGPEEEYSWGVTCLNDYVYVVGHMYESSKPDCDVFMVKYSGDGAVLWNVTWGSRLADIARSVAVEESNVYVAGITYRQGEDGQVFLLKYNSANEVSSLEMDILSTASIALGILALMVSILEILRERYV